MNRLASTVQCTLLFLIFVILLVHTLVFEKIPRSKNAGPTAKGFDSTIVGTNCEARGRICPLPTTLVYTNCTPSHSSDKFDYMIYLAQHSKHPIVRTISMLVPDLYYRTILSVRINGETYNKLNLDANFNSVTNISIVSGSDTCLVYQRPRMLQNYNKSATSMLFRDEDARRLFKRCHVWERMLDIATILPDIFDRSINSVRIDNVLLGDFNLSTEFKSINHIEVLEDGNWVTVYKRPDTIILHHQ